MARELPGTVKKTPNFLVVVADDLGFSDLQPYGGEIETPHLDWLATEGLRFTDFHTAPTCSPTRAMLLSGTDNHIAGLGAMWEQIRHNPEFYKGKKGYEGYLNFDVAALPEVLSDNGYHTIMSGKWHLGMQKHLAPCSRGFKKNFTYLAAAGNHYNNEPQLDADTPKVPSICSDNLWMEDDEVLDRKKDMPQDFYSTKSFTDKLLSYFAERSKEEREQPFFAYLAYTAPHWPLQAPQEIIAKYRGRYDDGPEALRWERLRSLQKLGLVPEGVEPAPIQDMGIRPWDKLTVDEKRKSARAMECFAAMVDQIDFHLGRVFDYLRSTQELDNTFVLFMSDNGAEGHILEAMPITKGVSITEVIAKYYDNSLNNIGNANSMVWYGSRWASAATAPSRGFKHHTSEGGIRCPCIVRYPPSLGLSPGAISDTFTNVMDIMPTILELAGVQHPGGSFRGRKVVPMRGKSWAPLLRGRTESVYDDSDDFTGWELFGCRAVRQGPWKALLMPPPRGTGDWQLYNLDKDPGEIHDRAATEPEILHRLIEHYELYYQESGLFDTSLAEQMAEKVSADLLGNFKGFSPSV